MPINRVDITVKTIGELRTVHVSELKDGAQAWVIEVEDFFVLIKDCGLVDDGIDIITPLIGSPRAGNATACWVRGLDLSEFFARQPIWYIDPVGGSDFNNGNSISTPLKTHEELVRRIDGALINIPVTVFLMNDFPQDNPVHVVFRVGPDGSMQYVSIKPLIVLHTGTFTTVNNIVPASNQPQIVEDSSLGINNWTGLINAATGDATRIRITDGSNVGAIAYPSRDLGADQVRTSPFVVEQLALPIGAISVVQPNPGDPFVVETGFLTIDDFLVNAGASTTNPTSVNVRLFFRDIAISNDAPRRAVVSLTGAADGVGDVFFSGCDVGRIDARDCRVVCDACKLSGLANDVKYGALSVSTSLVTQQLTAASGNYRTSISHHTLFDIGGRLFVENITLITEAAVFNSGSDGITVRPGGVLKALVFDGPPQIYGQLNGSFGMNINPGGEFFYEEDKPFITGNQGDLLFTGFIDGWNLFGDDLVNSTKQAGISKL